jgi:tetratricopeptide (TPR) repeat protein
MDLQTSNCYYLVGVFYLEHKYFAKALACFKRAAEIRENKLGEHECLADCWYNIGLTYK